MARKEVTRDEFFARINPLNVHPRSEREASYWETPSRNLIGVSTPGYMCNGAVRWFLTEAAQ